MVDNFECHILLLASSTTVIHTQCYFCASVKRDEKVLFGRVHYRATTVLQSGTVCVYLQQQVGSSRAARVRSKGKQELTSSEATTTAPLYSTTVLCCCSFSRKPPPLHAAAALRSSYAATSSVQVRVCATQLSRLVRQKGFPEHGSPCGGLESWRLKIPFGHRDSSRLSGLSNIHRSSACIEFQHF